ncbi:MAG: hypothetical protein PHH21_02250 [Candidatus Pacebacteria bacterium]|nr:hypothetical protein [Candidatus Paceibacterota bacterium]
MDVNIFILELASTIYLVAAWFCLGRSYGFSFKNIDVKGNYWFGITVYLIVNSVIFHFLAKMLAEKTASAAIAKTLEVQAFESSSLITVVLFYSIFFIAGYFSASTKNGLIAKKCKENLDKGKAVLTGIGIIVRIRNGGKFLVTVRESKESITGKDLSGLVQLITSAMLASDFTLSVKGDFQGPLRLAITRGLRNFGMSLRHDVSLNHLIPAFSLIEEKGVQNQIDGAFVVDIPFESIETGKLFDQLIENGTLKWVNLGEIREELEFIGPRMKFLATEDIFRPSF